jgi:hypothetical protein
MSAAMIAAALNDLRREGRAWRWSRFAETSCLRRPHAVQAIIAAPFTRLRASAG